MRLSRQSMACWLIATSLSTFGASPLLAQTATEAADEGREVEAQQIPSGIGDIVVTARRRSERLQETPISITAMTGDNLAKAQITSTTDLTRVTPSLQFTSQAPASGNNASSQIFIRGIGQTDFLPSTDPGVGLYIDGVYVARSVGGATDFGDIERVEVLRGPQGTLFGRNTIGGAINIISKRPEKELGGSVEVKTGTDNRFDITAGVDIPLTEGVYSKFQFVQRKQDGYVTRLIDGLDLGNTNSHSFRGALLLEPVSDLSIYLIGDYTRKNEHGAPQVFNSINPAAGFARLVSIRAGCPAPGTELADPRCANNQWKAGPFATNGTAPLKSESTVWGTSGTVEYTLGDVSLKSITAYRSTEWGGLRDADNTPFTILHTQIQNKTRQFSQEGQISGSLFDSRLKWLVGAYYFTEKSVDDYNVFAAPGNFANAGTYRNQSLAGFSQVSFDFTNKLSLTLGGRYGTEKRKFSPNVVTLSAYSFPAIPGFNSTVFPAPVNSFSNPGYTVLRTINGVTYVKLVNTVLSGDQVIQPNAAGNYAVPAGAYFYEPGEREVSTTDFVPMASLSYKWSRNFFTYLTYSEGFKAGGHSTRSTRPFVDVPAFGPEKAKSLEAGFKADLAGGLLRLNGDMFVTDYNDIQIVVREGFAPLVVNGGKARIWGGELEWTINPVEHLFIIGGLSYNENKYKRLSAASIANGVTPNNRLAFSPKFTINTGVTYDWEASDDITVTPRVDVYHQSKVFFDAVNTEAISQPGYTLVNASLTLSLFDKRLDITGSIINLTDKLYRVAGFSALDSAAAYAESTYARKRQWTLSAKYRF